MLREYDIEKATAKASRYVNTVQSQEECCGAQSINQSMNQ